MLNLANTSFMTILPLITLLPPLQFDFIIVGGGAAGCVVASRLTENPKVMVILLEAGGYPTILSQVPWTMPFVYLTNQNWKYKVAPQKTAFFSYINNQPGYAQGRVLGGSSTINGMMYIRGNPDDYDNWESMGNPGWRWSDCLPYFKKAEGNRIPSQESDTSYHNTSGPVLVSLAPYSTSTLQSFLQSCQSSGLEISDVNDANQTGVAHTPLTFNNGTRCSNYEAYIKPASQRKNLVVVPNALVTKILINGKKQAIGIKYIKNGLSNTVYASKEVIVSAGAFQSPKLLMLSGIGPISELQTHKIEVVAELPGVGRNLHDHVGCGALSWKVNCTGCTYQFLRALSPKSVLNFLFNRNGPLTLFIGNEGVGYLKTEFSNQSIDKPDIQIMFLSVNMGKYFLLTAPVFGMSIKDGLKYYQSSLLSEAFTIQVFNVNPKSRGTLTLKSREPTDPPIIDFKYLSDAADIKVLVAGVKKAVEVGRELPFQEIGAQLIQTVYPGCENITQFSDEYYECMCRHYTMIAYHAVGTCKMGPSSDPMAVVNSDLEVYKVSKLRVVDASIIPQVPNSNTCTPVTMIAEKICDVIKKKYNI